MWGRWVSADVVFAQLDVTDNNLFAYCGNDPMNYVDSEGLYKIPRKKRNEIENLGKIPLQQTLDNLGKTTHAMGYQSLSSQEKEYAMDYLCLLLFEYAAEQAKQRGHGAYHGEYGFVTVDNEYTIISIPGEVIVVDWTVANRFVATAISLLEEYWLETIIIVGGAIQGYIYSVGGLKKDAKEQSMESGKWRGKRSNEKKELKNIFNELKNDLDEFVIWIDFKAVYGKEKSTIFGKKPDIKDFWKWILG
jgi:hypothetical protein